MNEFDVVVIGAGPGGYVAAIRSAQLGLKTAIIEKSSTLGGTCLNVGCIPSKSLLQATELYAKLQREGKEQGIECSGLSVNLEKMMEKKNHTVKGLTEGVLGLMKKNKIETFEGEARFTSEHSIEVVSRKSRQEIRGKQFILATGSESIPLPFLPFDEKIVLSSTGALSLNQIPKKLLVIGAGVIGVELASVYNRLGSEVIIVEMLDHICPMIDSALSKVLLQSLKKQGIQFFLPAKVTGAEVSEKQVTLSMEYENEKKNLSADHVLVSVGRRPYCANLNINLEKNKRGFVAVDGNFRTSIAHIFAIGDVIDGPMLAHRASEEGVAVAEIIAGHKPRINYMAIPNVIYTHPEVAVVGLTEKEALDAGFQIKIGTFPFKANPRARCSGEETGLVKMIGEANSDRMIGLHIIGAHASEMIGEGVIAMEKQATITDLALSCHAHPTLSEAIKEAALNALGRTIHL